MCRSRTNRIKEACNTQSYIVFVSLFRYIITMSKNKRPKVVDISEIQWHSSLAPIKKNVNLYTMHSLYALLAMHSGQVIRGGINNFRYWRCHLYCSCSSAMQRQIIVLAHLESQCTNFHVAGWTCRFLRPFIWCRVSGRWDFAMDPAKEQHHILCKSRDKCDRKTLTMVRQAFGEESISRTRVFKWHVRFRGRPKKARQWRAKSRSC
jgi:hypothetical protein